MPQSTKDIRVALPGPLGEYAFYSFLENFIRNAIKHNKGYMDNNPDQDMAIYVNVKQSENDEDFYECEVWENISNPQANRTSKSDNENEPKLIDDISEFAEKSIIDAQGQLRKKAWGIAEMKIMATLLCGSDNFMQMQDNLKVCSEEKNGKNALVYQFKLMKPKEIAIIAKNFSNDKDNLRKQGIWVFSSLEHFKSHITQGQSSASFNFVLISNDCGVTPENIKENLHLFPFRVLIHEGIYNDKVEHDHINKRGVCKVNDDFIGDLKSSTTDEILSKVWDKWVAHLKSNHGLDATQLLLFFQQEPEAEPTEGWITEAESLNKKRRSITATVLTTHWKESILDEHKYLVFDRHSSAFTRINRGEQISFHQALEKNSADFAPLFCSEPSDVMFYQMAEAALLKILVLDERIAEVAADTSIQGHGSEFAQKKYESRARSAVADCADILIGEYLLIDGQPKELHKNVSSQNGRKRICIECSFKEGGYEFAKFDIYKCSDDISNSCKDNPIKNIDMLIIHQGVLENFFVKRNGEKTETVKIATKDKIQRLLDSLREFIPYIVVDSGRGIPTNLPETEKFLPFSLLENYLMQDCIAKYSLSKILMSLTRRGES